MACAQQSCALQTTHVLLPDKYVQFRMLALILSSLLVTLDAGWPDSDAQFEECQRFMGNAHLVTSCTSL